MIYYNWNRACDWYSRNGVSFIKIGSAFFLSWISVEVKKSRREALKNLHFSWLFSNWSLLKVQRSSKTQKILENENIQAFRRSGFLFAEDTFYNNTKVVYHERGMVRLHRYSNQLTQACTTPGKVAVV